MKLLSLLSGAALLCAITINADTMLSGIVADASGQAKLELNMPIMYASSTDTMGNQIFFAVELLEENETGVRIKCMFAVRSPNAADVELPSQMIELKWGMPMDCEFSLGMDRDPFKIQLMAMPAILVPAQDAQMPAAMPTQMAQ